MADFLGGGNAETLKAYWTHGKGALEIRWGSKGDFERCVRAIRKHAPTMTDPEGYCNVLHRLALGTAPGQGPHAAGFKEGQHPRDAQGQWTGAPGGGGRAVPEGPGALQGLTETLGSLGNGKGLTHNDVHALKVSPSRFDVTTPSGETRSYQHAAHVAEVMLSGTHNAGRSRTTQKGLRAAGALPDLVTLPGVDIVAAGRWKLASGEQTFTTADLRGAVQAAQCPAVGPPIIKIGHTDPHFDGEPALGRVTDMTLAAEGNKITGDLSGMPAWLAAAAPSAYPRRSIEGVYDFQCSIGHTHPFVITGLALLGVTAPGVGVLSGLPRVAALYGVAAGAPQWRTDPQGGDMPGQVQAAAITELDVRRAYYEAAGVAQTFWITELQMDPAQLIVADEATSKVYRVPFHIDASSGGVQFDDPQEVAIRYEDLGALAASRGSGPVVAYASAAASRAQPAPQAGGEDHGNIEAADSADLNAAARAYCASQGWAMRDGSYPVRPATLHGASDLEKAVGAVGRGGGSHDAIRAHIMARAQAIGLTAKVPDNWGAGGKQKAAGDPGVRVDAAGRHTSYTGTHSHPHAAMGAQGADQQHDHSHTHDGTGSHAHVHAAGGTEGGNKVDFTDEQMTALRAALGLGEDEELTAAQVVTAAGALRERADAKKVAASGPLPPGVIAVDQEAWDEVNRKVTAAEAFRGKVLRGERDQIIAAAISAGKFPPARRAVYERLWDADPEGTRTVIASLRKNAVPMEDIGAAGGADDDDADGEYRDLFPPDLRAASARPGA